jgi:hypothetical protein
LFFNCLTFILILFLRKEKSTDLKVLVQNTQHLNISAKEENKKSEVSTQTSFIINENKQKRYSMGSSFNSSNHHLLLKQMNKDKIQELIQAQKQKHEKRMRELEKLAELEKIQAEKLKNIMLDDSSLLMSNSFFTNLANSKEEYLVKKRNLQYPNTMNRFDEFSELNEISTINNENNIKPSVQILDLKNTTVHEQPSGVRVIKENQSGRNIFDYHHHHHHNHQINRKSPFDRRNTEIYIAKSSNTNNFNKRMSLANNLNNNNNTNKLKTNVGLSNNFEINLHDRNAANMSLQEAFETFRCDLISRSRLRQKEIKYRAEKRQQEAAELLKHNHQNEINNNTENRKNDKKSCLKKSLTIASCDSRRRMSIQEIKIQNKKLYEKLPEVKQKQMQQRIEEEKRLNRIKSSIFKKV